MPSNTDRQNSSQYSSHLIAKAIEHTLLKAEATSAQIDQLCEEARDHGFAGVCVNSLWIPRVVSKLKDSEVLAVTVVGFPLGASATEAKAAETRWAVAQGAQEIDMVLSIGLLKTGDIARCQADIAAVVEAAVGLPVKVILETALLTQAEKSTACELSKNAGAAFVKTSTGFSTGGATVADVQLMRKIVGPGLGVKASGGIRSRADAIAMIEAGANRLGTSAGVAIVTADAGASGQGY